MMSRSRVWGTVAAAVLLAGAAGAALAADEPDNIVKYRQAYMRANGAHITMFSAMVKDEVSWDDELVGHAHAIHEQSRNLLRLFPEGTAKGEVGVDTRAMPAIWERWADFEEAAQAFEQESAKLVEAAESGDQTAIAQQLAALGRQGCGNCHETFREERN